MAGDGTKLDDDCGYMGYSLPDSGLATLAQALPEAVVETANRVDLARVYPMGTANTTVKSQNDL